MNGIQTLEQLKVLAEALRVTMADHHQFEQARAAETAEKINQVLADTTPAIPTLCVVSSALMIRTVETLLEAITTNQQNN